MIPPAPTDLWKQVIDRLAELIWERERRLSTGVTEAPPPHPALRSVPPPKGEAS